MKRILIFILTVVLSFSLVSCSMITESIDNIKSGTAVLKKHAANKDKENFEADDEDEDEDDEKEETKKETEKKEQETKETEKVAEETKAPETSAPQTDAVAETAAPPAVCSHKSSGAASCTKNETCTYCGVVLMYAYGHKYSGGYCTRCGKTDPNYKTNTHSHSYTSYVSKQPTCTSAGTLTYKCSCGDSYTESVAKTGHSWMEKTCFTPKTCSSCWKTEGSARSHSYSSGICVYCGTLDPSYSVSYCSSCGVVVESGERYCYFCKYYGDASGDADWW
ncbi:MAG: hypothetical protein IKU52_01150 [Clostridia bacterium]|nr:hypothetical protein [Clostridia bacterium]